MVKISKIPTDPIYQLSQRLRGNVSIRLVGDGVVAAAWPKKRGPTKNAEQLQRQSWFTQQIQATKFISADDRASAEYFARGTDYTWRDVVMKCWGGNFILAQMADGSVLYPSTYWRFTMNFLDTISQVPGSILYRGDVTWKALAPGTAGQVLTAQGAGAAPQWGVGNGAVNAPIWIGNPYGAVSTSAYACKGTVFQPAADSYVDQLAFYLDEVYGATYKAGIYRIVAGTCDLVAGESAVYTAPSTATVTRLFSITPTALLTAGSIYACVLTRTDGSGTTAIGTHGAAADPGPYPITPLNQYCRVASTSPGVGTTFGIGSNANNVALRINQKT